MKAPWCPRCRRRRMEPAQLTPATEGASDAELVAAADKPDSAAPGRSYAWLCTCGGGKKMNRREREHFAKISNAPPLS